MGVVTAEYLHVVVVAGQVGQGPAEGGHAGGLGGLAEPAGVMRRRDRRRGAVLARVGGDPVGKPAAPLPEQGGLGGQPGVVIAGFHRQEQPAAGVERLPAGGGDGQQAADQAGDIPVPAAAVHPLVRNGRRPFGRVEADADAPCAGLGLAEPDRPVAELDIGQRQVGQFLGGAVGHGQQEQHPERLQVQFAGEQHPAGGHHQPEAAVPVPGARAQHLADRGRPGGDLLRQPGVQRRRGQDAVPGSPHQVRRLAPSPQPRVLAAGQQRRAPGQARFQHGDVRPRHLPQHQPLGVGELIQRRRRALAEHRPRGGQRPQPLIHARIPRRPLPDQREQHDDALVRLLRTRAVLLAQRRLPVADDPGQVDGAAVEAGRGRISAGRAAPPVGEAGEAADRDRVA